jgi:virulence-associated protein VapD
MNNFDLDLDNYDLNELLGLFKLNIDFTEHDLKRAKKVAIMMHPDKSGLDKEYFQFFKKAYKMVEQIHLFRHKQFKNAQNKEYITDDKDNAQLIKKKFHGKPVKEFNKWFNEAFEKIKMYDEENDSGYGDWLKSNENLEDNNVKSVSDFDSAFERKNSQLRALVKRQEVGAIGSNSGYDLVRDKPTYHSSEIFSELPYEDLKKAYSENGIGVSKSDYENRRKYDNVDDLIRQRGTGVEPLSLEQSKNLLKEKEMKIKHSETQRAYRILKQDEQIRNKNKEWWSQLNRLEN